MYQRLYNQNKFFLQIQLSEWQNCKIIYDMNFINQLNRTEQLFKESILI